MTKEPSKYKIYIDSSSRYEKSVILFRETGASETPIAKKTGDLDVVAAVSDLLQENNITIEDVDVVEPNLGPGSFTGLKIGVTAANVFMWALGKKNINNLYIPDYGKEPNVTVKTF